MNSIFRDVSFALRGLVKRPAFAGLAVIILALTIAATTAIFTVVNGVLLRPLPFPEPENLLVINEVNPQQSPEPFELSYLNWLDVQRQSKSFEEIAGVTFSSAVLEIGGEPSRVETMGVSANLFPLLRAQVAQGRTFLPDEEKPGANRVAVVSHRFWQQHFANQQVNGQGIKLDNRDYSVVGVMPAGFQFPTTRWMCGCSSALIAVNAFFRITPCTLSSVWEESNKASTNHKRRRSWREFSPVFNSNMQAKTRVTP